MIMKLTVWLFFLITASNLSAQKSPQEIMEDRARHLHRAINSSEQAAWTNFVRENYSQAFIDKAPSRKVVVNGEEQSSSNAADSGKNKVETKTELLAMLHHDFGGSQILSLKYKDFVVDMVLLSSDGLKGSFKLTFQKQAPYLIDNMGVEASMDR